MPMKPVGPKAAQYFCIWESCAGSSFWALVSWLLCTALETVVLDEIRDCMIFAPFLDMQYPNKAQLTSQSCQVLHLSRSSEGEPQILGQTSSLLKQSLEEIIAVESVMDFEISNVFVERCTFSKIILCSNCCFLVFFFP